MAGVKEYSGADLNTISRLNGVSNVLGKINGVTVTAVTFTGLLDTYTGATQAYSVRRLNSLYTGACMRVREDGTNTETDIGFDSNGDLDTAAIATHCGSANGYVSKWYDQSQSGGTGSGTDADQTTAASQPQIYNGTSVTTDNGKPALDFDGTDDNLDIDYTSTFTNISTWTVHAGTGGAVLSGYNAAGSIWHFFSTDMTSGSYRSVVRNTAKTLVQVSTGTTSDTQVLQHLLYDRTNVEVAVDGGTASTAAAALGDIATPSTGLSIGQAPNGSTSMNGTIQEVLLWNSDESSNRTGIESDINTYFSIYT